MTDTFRVAQNTQLMSQTGGTQSVAENKDVVASWADALNASSYPLYTKAKKNRSVDNPVHQWGQGRKIRKDTALSAGINNSTVSIPVATGDGLILQNQGFLEIMDFRPGTTEPDETTREVVYVTGISGDTATVAARGTYSPALAHSSGAQVRFVGTGEPENGSHTEAPRTRGFKLFNYPQRFQAKLTADKRAQNTPTWATSGNPLLEDYADEVEKQKELIERWMFIGTRNRGDYTPGSSLPSTFGGINSFLTSNTINMGGNPLRPSDMEAIMKEIWYDLEGAKTPGMVWLMGMDEAMILDSSINPVRRGNLQDDSINTVVRQYKTRIGNIDVEPIYNVPRGNLYLVNWQWINLLPYKGLDWHKGMLKGEDNAQDSDVFAISGDFTLEVLHEEAMARIYNFDMDPDNYASIGYY